MQLTKKELKDLLKSYDQIHSTPLLYTSGGTSLVDCMIESFDVMWQKIAQKYGFDPEKRGFNRKTGEIV